MHSTIRHDVLRIILIGIALLTAGFFCVKQFTSLNSLQWLLFADCLWFYVCWQLWRRLELNRAHDTAPLYPRLGWANHLTVLRGGLIALTGGFLFQPQTYGWTAWIPGVLYAVAALLDRMDGFVARRGKQTSLLGSELDTVYDALGLLVAPLLAVGYGKVHWSFLFVSAAYYIFTWGQQWRRSRNLPIYPLMPSMLRRTLAGFQMGFIAFILLPCFPAPLTIIAGFAFMLPILLGFIADWLVVSGRIQNSAANTRFFNRIAQISHSAVQPFLRVVMCAALIFLVQQDGVSLNTFVFLFLLLCAAMVILGVAGRVGSLMAVSIVTYVFGSAIVNPVTATIVCTGAWLMLLGTGRFSVWQWDDEWVNRRDGEEDQ